MGNAYVSAGSGSSSIYFNPALIAGAGLHEIEALYTPLPLGGSFASFFYSASVNLRLAGGIGVVSLKSGEADKRNIWGEHLGPFSSSKKALYLTGAFIPDAGISIGLNLKYIIHSMDGFEDSGMGVDTGIKYAPSEKLSLAVSARNIAAPALKLKNETESFPLNITAGLSYLSPVPGLIFSADTGIYDFSGEPALRWGIGSEYTMFQYLKLRAGINYKELSAGIGLDAGDFSFSYSARYSVLGLFSAISTSYRFGMLPSAREREILRKEKLIKEKEKNFETWQAEKKNEFMENMRRELNIIEEEEKLSEKRRRELDALVEAALSLKGGEYEKAERQLSDILSENPGSKDAHTLLEIVRDELNREFSFGRMLEAYNQNNYEAALAEFAKAEIMDPQYKEAKIIGALSSARLNILDKKYSLAEKELKNLLEIAPDNSAAKTLLKRLKRLKELSGEN